MIDAKLHTSLSVRLDDIIFVGSYTLTYKMDQILHGTATNDLTLNVNIGFYNCENVEFIVPEIIEEDLAPVYIWPEPIPVNYIIEGMSAPCLTTTKIIRYREDSFQGEFPYQESSIAWD